MTHEIKRGVPLKEIRVKLGYQIPSWKHVSEGLSLNGMNKKDKETLRMYFSAQVLIALGRTDFAQVIFQRLESDGFKDFEKVHWDLLGRITKLVRHPKNP